MWVIPADGMKASKEHRVPLSTQALEVLQKARKLSRGKLVFPGQKRNVMIGDKTINKTLNSAGVNALRSRVPFVVLNVVR